MSRSTHSRLIVPDGRLVGIGISGGKIAVVGEGAVSPSNGA
jgi:hypothetical protein